MTTKYGLPAKAIQQIQDVFKTHPHINKVVLYGSRALGTYKSGSDIDLCIESKDLTLSELLVIENQLDDLLLPWKIDLSLKSHIDNQALLQHINDHSILFYPHLGTSS